MGKEPLVKATSAVVFMLAAVLAAFGLYFLAESNETIRAFLDVLIARHSWFQRVSFDTAKTVLRISGALLLAFAAVYVIIGIRLLKGSKIAWKAAAALQIVNVAASLIIALLISYPFVISLILGVVLLVLLFSRPVRFMRHNGISM